jgi:hypothetical protein
MASSAHQLSVEAAAAASSSSPSGGASQQGGANPGSLSSNGVWSNGNNNNNNNNGGITPISNGHQHSSSIHDGDHHSSPSLPLATPLSSDTSSINIPRVNDLTQHPSISSSSSSSSSSSWSLPLLSASSKGRSHPGSSSPVAHAYRRLWTALSVVMILRGIIMVYLHLIMM